MSAGKNNIPLHSVNSISDLGLSSSFFDPLARPLAPSEDMGYACRGFLLVDVAIPQVEWVCSPPLKQVY